MQLHFALDFDGTISLVDTTDLLLATFADGSWQEIEEEWCAGRIGSRECMSRQVALLEAPRAAMLAALADVKLDPHFAAFVTRAWLCGATVSVVSDGFDLAIIHLLHANGIDLPVTSNRLVETANGRWQAAFSNRGEQCPSGTCKCAAVPANRRVVLVGDGRSDFCLARRADFVLAKGSLAAFCAAEGIPHRAISGFADALAFLDPLRARRHAAPSRLMFEDIHA
ncbi:HAD-IB family phosphatase [Xanthobacter sp. 91]|uniref:HAD-IB family phosphatase n=1 Tax=Xanthobacter sp. 91 TaxID=1117244 RepID=UPI00056DA3DB|nr:HAD-IB family phosphatase [Xanthobacter sp. 91]